MRLSFLVEFITQINAAIDTGKYSEIAVHEVEKHIAEHDLIPFLVARLGNDVDLAMFTAESRLKDDYGEELNQQLLGLLEVYHGQEMRKWGVQNNGLCLLIAWTAEIIVGKKWD